MKTGKCGIGLISATVVAFAASALHAQVGPVFTYQGQLRSGGSPANGIHDLRFRLFKSDGVTQVGATICANDVNIVEGLFTLPLDFGNQFDGTKRMLEVAVRVDTGVACGTGGGYTVLAPQQELTPAPYAQFAPNAGAIPWTGIVGIPAGFADGIDNIGATDGHSLDAADGSPVDVVFVNNAGNVGIGTTSPAELLHIASAQPRLVLQDTDSTPTNQLGFLSLRDSAGTERGWVGYGSQVNAHMHLWNARPGGNTALGAGNAERLTITSAGNVGIGTTTPASKLHVEGSIRANGGVDVINSPTNPGGSVSLTFGQDLAGVNVARIRIGGSGTGVEGGFDIQRQGNASLLRVLHNGFVGIGTVTPQQLLDVNGTARVKVLEITGADLAEKFPTTDKVEPGMVVAIDAKNEGKLCLARGAYNSCVAGVVSGANSFSAGAILGNLPGHEDAPPIALSGRVYVRCDASDSAIQPGDLLTTSDTPGHAMKAADRERSHGAVIGKAMTALARGERGLVLVLVNLQ